MTMKTCRILVPALLAAVLLPGGALADGVTPRDAATAGGGTTAISGTTGDAAVSAGLSLGDQKIASALYEAQRGSAAKRGIRLDDIASARQEGLGWSDIFHRMKAKGLVREKNVGEVIGKYARRDNGEASASAAREMSADAGSRGGAPGRTRSAGPLGRGKAPSAATAGSKLKPVARPGGGKPGSRSVLTLALARPRS